MSDTQNITRYIDALPVIAMVFHGQYIYEDELIAGPYTIITRCGHA
ncbi:MAG: hypothetical protein UW18_C0020G0009 [Microgenomates group bacterium GW2011_GWF1_44_10]|nr:MAG: hypothetical protein UW18_C0020G0009 [Microgenomates group bacterium GW2011_GWF1_44_10]